MLLQGHANSEIRPPSLEFDSQFESGNLQQAVQASYTFPLILVQICMSLLQQKGS